MLVAVELTWQQGTNKLQRKEDVGWEGHEGLAAQDQQRHSAEQCIYEVTSGLVCTGQNQK